MEVKLKKYRIKKAGTRGLAVSIPQNWIDLNELKKGDCLIFSQDEKNRLIIEKAEVVA